MSNISSTLNRSRCTNQRTSSGLTIFFVMNEIGRVFASSFKMVSRLRVPVIVNKRIGSKFLIYAHESGVPFNVSPRGFR